MIDAEHAVLYAMTLCFGTALLTLALARRPEAAGWVTFVATAASSLLVLTGAGRVLLYGPGRALTVLALPRLEFALRLYVDGLSALFLGVIATVVLPATLYSIEYMRQQEAPGSRRYHAALLSFMGAMYGLVSTTDMMYFFFIFWQIMTLAGFSLIRFERHQPGSARAAMRYLLMMQLACGLTLVGAAILASSGGASPPGESLMRHDFDAVMRQMPAQLKLHPGWVAAAFGLFLAGFGIKLGMWPFGQVWLPDAHPAAPSPVSALLSGVMIKTGVYGLMRYFIWLVPAEALRDYPAAGWGALMTLLGTASLFLGTVQALKQDQTKRLLAYSSIGQGGYILLGLGVCLSLLGSREPGMVALAAAGFYGALFHVINHSVFKSLLFLNAGSVLRATGTQDMNQLGGLLRYMPVTGATALVASFSIAGVPLFSGFASKWSMYVGAIQGHAGARWLPACAMVAILTSALTLALMLKFFGAVFLTRTSALVARRAGAGPSLEGGWKMKLAQLSLAALCLWFGLVPAAGFELIRRALSASRQGLGAVLADAAPVSAGAVAGASFLAGQAVYVPLALLGAMVLIAAFTRWLTRLGGAPRRSAAPWLCGYATDNEGNRYRARHFYTDVRRYLGWAGGEPPPLPTPGALAPSPAEPKPAPWLHEKN